MALKRILLVAFLAVSSPSSSQAEDFSLFGILDFVKKINYQYLETFVNSELRKLWDQEIGNFLLCAGTHPTAGTAGWGIYSKEDLEKYACDEEWKIKRLKQAGKKLSEIFDNESLPSAEKSFSVAAEIEGDALNYTRKFNVLPRFGAGYSLRYGVLRLHFSNMLSANNLCPGIETVTVQTPNGIETRVVTFTERIYIQPSYKITKYVNGTPEVLANVKEELKAVRESSLGLQIVVGKINNFSVKWLDAVNGMYKYLSAEDKLESFNGGDIVFYDFNVDLRPKNSTLKYKLEVAHSGGHSCPSPRNWVQELEADVDGDGIIDFVPKEHHERYVSHLNFVPVGAITGIVYANTGNLPEFTDCFVAGENDVVPLIYSPVYTGGNPQVWMAEKCGPIFQ